MTIFIFFIFPKQLLGNIYVLTGYLIICIIFLNRYFKFKSKILEENNLDLK